MSETSFETLTAIINCNSRISKKLEHYLGSLHGLGLSEFLVLHHLETSKSPMSRINLADRISLTASGVTRLLQPMEKLGLVERQANERDARLSLVKISEAGSMKFKDAYQSFEEAMANILGSITANEKATLLSLLNKIN